MGGCQACSLKEDEQSEMRFDLRASKGHDSKRGTAHNKADEPRTRLPVGAGACGDCGYYCKDDRPPVGLSREQDRPGEAPGPSTPVAADAAMQGPKNAKKASSSANLAQDAGSSLDMPKKNKEPPTREPAAADGTAAAAAESQAASDQGSAAPALDVVKRKERRIKSVTFEEKLQKAPTFTRFRTDSEEKAPSVTTTKSRDMVVCDRPVLSQEGFEKAPTRPWNLSPSVGTWLMPRFVVKPAPPGERAEPAAGEAGAGVEAAAETPSHLLPSVATWRLPLPPRPFAREKTGLEVDKAGAAAADSDTIVSSLEGNAVQDKLAEAAATSTFVKPVAVKHEPTDDSCPGVAQEREWTDLPGACATVACDPPAPGDGDGVAAKATATEP